ncbi:YY1-associated factor 2 [Anabrus simplex]|uniref:YY1-associated factor 2 n=1 Tax=Anabrus simplex TaxID=316456 RepID=UPI0034DCCAA9
MECKQTNLHKITHRTKRQAKVLEDNFWDCSVCTYRNTAEAFKCLMCDVRKGTSTRKPRINPQLVAQQYSPTPAKTNKKEGLSGTKEKADKNSHSGNKSVKKSGYPPRLKNVDRSSAQTREVTVNNVTVLITEYKPKVKKSASDQSGQSSSASSEDGSQSESSLDARSADVGTDSRSSL